MSRPYRTFAFGILLAVSLLCGCGERPPVRAEHLTRSESASLELPTDPIPLAALLAVAPESLRAAGEERYFAEAFDSARAILTVEVTRARADDDSAAEARALMWLGLAEYRLGDYVAARRDGEASLFLKRQVGLDDELSRSFNALGLLAWNEGRHHDALQHFDSATVTAERHQDARGVSRAISNIPLVLVELGKYDAARRGFLAARVAGRQIDDDRTEGNALANLAMLEIRLGSPDRALPLLAEARHHYAVAEYATGEANALGQLATAFSGLGDLQRAIAAADSGIAIARTEGLLQEVAATLEVLADLHAQAGSWRLALRSLREADSLDAMLGLAVERGNNLRRTAAILLVLGEALPAAARAEEALGAHREIGAWGEIVDDRIQLAEAYAASGNPRAAKAQADSALLEGATIKNPSSVQDAAVLAARLALAAGDPRRALLYLESVGATEATDWVFSDIRAATFLALGRLDEAQVEGKRSVALLERERASLGMGPFRSAYLTNRVGPFSRLVSINLALRDTTAAFEVAATLPGRALAERLGGMLVQRGGIEFLAEGERHLLRAAALERELVKTTAGEQRVAIQRELESVRARYEEHLAHRTPFTGDRLLGHRQIKLADVQSALTSEEALLTFVAGPERLDVFLVRRGAVLHRSVAIGASALAVRVRLARELLTRTRPGQEPPGALAELHEMLLGPAVAAGSFEGMTHLLIVPQGPLGALPFAALRNAKTGRFLVEDYVISYLPTVAALADSSPTAAVSFGRMVVFAPLPESLPGTGREARAIGRLLPTAELRVGTSSNERAVVQALEAGRPVHLASHGSQNALNPLFSRIIVGRAGGSQPNNDGRLEVHEIIGLHTSSPLVFLSGCETGLGAAGQEPFPGGADEGALSQAFLVAGARSVVATLWRVDDAGAAELAERFYRYLSSGSSAEEALARGQRDLIRSTPGFTWAAYATFGPGGRKSAAGVRITGMRL
ncbi:MAG: CHAT domain-containing protein [Gemmatimonadota bacterium]